MHKVLSYRVWRDKVMHKALELSVWQVKNAWRWEVYADDAAPSVLSARVAAFECILEHWAANRNADPDPSESR